MSASTAPTSRAVRRAPARSTDAPGRRVTSAAGLPFSVAEERVREVGDRRRAGNAVAREVRHQVEVEGQLRRRQPLEQRQDVAAVRGGDEVVGVLDPGRDALQLDERADRVALQPVGELASA